MKLLIKLYSDNFLKMLNIWIGSRNYEVMCPYNMMILNMTADIISSHILASKYCDQCAQIFQFEDKREKFLNLDKFKNKKQKPQGPCPCYILTLPNVMKRLNELGYKLDKNNEWGLNKIKKGE
jgi:hypothetical protein